MTAAVAAAAPFAGAVAFARDGRLAAALAGSLAAHAALLGALALLVGFGVPSPVRVLESQLRATLVAPPQRYAVPTPEVFPAPPAPVPAPSAASTPAPARAPASLALPLPLPPPVPAPEPVGGGQVIIAIEEAETVAPEIERLVGDVHPGAPRAPIDFEVAPQGRYPEALRDERVQALLHVVVVVTEDGTVEVPPGTFDDPRFGEAVREALAGARARPAVVDGAPRTSWNVLSFYFEAFGSAESGRTKYERTGR